MAAVAAAWAFHVDDDVASLKRVSTGWVADEENHLDDMHPKRLGDDK